MVPFAGWGATGAKAALKYGDTAVSLAKHSDTFTSLTRNASKAAEKTSKIDRAAFKVEREAFWKAEAKANPGKYTRGDLVKMQKGKAPTGADGHPIELHHVDRTPEGGLQPMTRTDHRLGENYKKNHP